MTLAPNDLTLPTPGSTTARAVLSRAIGRLLPDLRDVLQRPIAHAALRRDVSALARAISSIPDRAAALSSVVRRPNVSALIRSARVQAVVEPALLSELVSTLAVELAVQSALVAPVRIEAPPRRVVSLAGRLVLDLPERCALEISSERLVIEHADGRDVVTPDAPEGRFVRRPFHAVERGILLALEDNNPLAMFEAHPNKSGNRIDLGGRSVAEWCDALRDALARIGRYLPDLRAEIDLFVQQLVPVGFDEEAHLSASYREAIGTIYLSLHPQPMTMTEAIVHEFSHNKINALFEIDDVLHDAYAPVYKSPVRPDPRPLHGVLLAVHAFVPVARLYEAMREAGDPLAGRPGFDARFAAIVAGNREGLDVLRAHARPTPAGRALLDELDRWDRHFA